MQPLWKVTCVALLLLLCCDQSMTLLDGSSHGTLKAKLAASSARIAASSLPQVPIPRPLPRATVASAFQSLSTASPAPPTLLSTPSVRAPRSPATSPGPHPNTASLSNTRPSPSANKETLSLEDTPAVRKEKAKLDKQDKQRQKQDRKAEQKAAKEERRLSKKVEKDASKREQEQQESEQKSKEDEERKSKEELQAVSSRAASAAVQVHSPPSSLGGSIVDELSQYLAASSLTGVTQHLDQHFEQMLESKRTKPLAAELAENGDEDQRHSAPPPGFAPLSAVSSTPLSSRLLTSKDAERAARIDFDKLDRAMRTTHHQPPPSSQQQPRKDNDKAKQSSSDGEQKQKQQHDEAEADDYKRYQQQQAAQLVPDDGEYDQIAEGADDDNDDAGVADAPDSGGNWDDQLDDESDSKRDVNDVDIAALHLQDVTEEEIILAMVREFEAKQAAEDGLTHDVSAADMTDKLRTYLLDQQEEGPDGFDRQSASEKRRQIRANETEEERGKRKEFKYKQRAQDAAEGILDWDWSSDSDTSASEEDENGEEEEEEEEEDVAGEDDELDEDEVDMSEEDEEEDSVSDQSDDELAEDDESTAPSDKGAPAAVCTCFKPLSAHDPAIIAAQLESFVSSDVISHHTYHLHPTLPRVDLPHSLVLLLLLLSMCWMFVTGYQAELPSVCCTAAPLERSPPRSAVRPRHGQ